MATYSGIKKIKIGDNVFELAVDWSNVTNPPTIPTNTDEKLKTVALTSGTTYYPVLATGADAAANRQVDSTLKGLRYKSTAGTTSTVGTAILTLGNGTQSGQANNEKGQIVLYGSMSNTYTIDTGSTAVNVTLTLPNKTGTIAVTSDIPTVPSNIVNTITTTAGAHTAISSKTGTVSFNVPTKTSHLTNDSGFITAHQDISGKLDKTGGTMTGAILMDSEQPIQARINRKQAGSGGWSYTPFKFLGKDDATFAQIGAYGTDDSFSYIFIGGNGYNGANLRILPSGKISVAGHASEIGYIKNTYLATATSVPTGLNAGTNLCSLSLEAGVWIVTVGIRHPSNATGIRAGNVTETSGSNSYDISQQAVNGNHTQQRWCTVCEFSSTKTIYLNAMQTSGSTLTYPTGGVNFGTFMRAVRIQ